MKDKELTSHRFIKPMVAPGTPSLLWIMWSDGKVMHSKTIEVDKLLDVEELIKAIDNLPNEAGV